MSREVVIEAIESSCEEDIKPEVKVEKREIVFAASESEINTAEIAKTELKSEPSNDVESSNSIPYGDDEEDVPSDFFDDFSNQDFMAGLDIVDAWDDDILLCNKDQTKKNNDSRKPRNKRKRSEKEKDRRRYSRSPVRRSRRSRDKSRGSKDKDRKHRSKDVKSKEKPKENDSKEGDEQVTDHRRDPEKTKRDIQKDKDKCAKNKEAKIISEKLKVVETGLVPPGMEMEVDLKQLKSVMPQVKEMEKKPTTTTTTREEKEKGRSTREERGKKSSYERRRRSRSINFEVAHSKLPLKDKHYSPKRRSTERNREHRVRLRSRSPCRARSRSRSPYYRRRISSERKLYIEERKRFNNRYRNTSPTVIRRKSRDRSLTLSPISNLSEREMWLRQRERNKRDRKISCSPISDSESINRKRSHDFLEELANKLKSDRKKISFLKEIHERLNEPSQHDSNNYSLGPGPVPPPIPGVNPILGVPNLMHGSHPVPSPGFIPGPSHQYFPQPSDPAPQYDQQFFIGQPDMFHNPNPYGQSFMGPRIEESIALIPDSIIVAHPKQSPLPNFNGNKNNVDLLKAQKAAEAQKEKDQEAVTKLFEDKKISLSDFLSVSAKHTDSLKPVNVQKKIKVISLCQDAIKSLGGDSKLGGRFFLKKTFKEPEKKEETKYQSPLRKIPVVRFSFTTPSKSGDDKSTLQSNTNKLLASLGLAEISRPITPKPDLSPVSSEASTRSIPVKKVAPVKTPPPPRKYDPILGAKFQMKMCQTDVLKCNSCEIRKSRKFVDQGTQCSMKTFDTGTQITEEDVQRLNVRTPVKDAFRNQSLAHLTPAQILAAQSGGLEESPKKDGSRMITPSPPDISPEKQNMRGILSNNDSFPNRSEYHDNRYIKPDHFNINTPTNNRPGGGFKLPSIFDKLNPNAFENVNRSNNPFNGGSKPNNPFESMSSRLNFDNRPNVMPQQHNDNRFRGTNQSFNQRMADDEFDYEQLSDNYGGSNNQRSFLPNNRGNFFSRPYGGARKF